MVKYISNSSLVSYLMFDSHVHLPAHDTGETCSLTDYFAGCPVFPSQIEKLESHESGLDLNGNQFIYIDSL